MLTLFGRRLMWLLSPSPPQQVDFPSLPLSKPFFSLCSGQACLSILADEVMEPIKKNMRPSQHNLSTDFSSPFSRDVGGEGGLRVEWKEFKLSRINIPEGVVL
jgi:hypothetical protein